MTWQTRAERTRKSSHRHNEISAERLTHTPHGRVRGSRSKGAICCTVGHGHASPGVTGAHRARVKFPFHILSLSGFCIRISEILNSQRHTDLTCRLGPFWPQFSSLSQPQKFGPWGLSMKIRGHLILIGTPHSPSFSGVIIFTDYTTRTAFSTKERHETALEPPVALRGHHSCPP